MYFFYIVCILFNIYSRSPESPSPVQSDKSNQKSNKGIANSVEQKPLHDAPVRSTHVNL